MICKTAYWKQCNIRLLILICLIPVNICFARINFIHIPKSGGTTVIELFKKNKGNSSIYPYGKIGKSRIYTYQLKKQQDVFEEFPEISQDLVMGHFPYWFFQNKDPDFNDSFFFTVLRDPVERVLSHARYSKRVNGVYRSPLDIPPNVLCKMLCSDPSLKGEDLLRDSMKNLERMDYILFLENFEGDLRSLFMLLGLKEPHSIPVRNTTEKEEVSEQMKKRVRKLNSLDVRLYEYAKEHVKNGRISF